MEYAEFSKLIPHRYPLLLVDRVLKLEPQVECEAVKNVSLNEIILHGHFPNNPIYPAAYIIDGLCQCHQMLMGMEYAVTAKLDKWRFRFPVNPGDQIHYHVKLKHKFGEVYESEATASVDGKVCAKGIMTAARQKMG